MSLSELFDISRTTRRDKARAQHLLPTPTTTSSTPARLCNICYAKPAAYNCPRCNIPFCSLICFRKQQHQECSAAFSSSSLSLVGRPDQGAAEEDRTKVVDILARLERNEKDAKLIQEGSDDDDNSDDDDVDEQVAAVRARVTEDQIESASTDALMAMLTEKERRRFLDAVKDRHSAGALMYKLDRKAERRARTAEARAAPQGVLVAPQAASEDSAQQRNVTTKWQSRPWFDKPEASPYFSSESLDDIKSFVQLVGSILSAESSDSKARVSAPVDLVYNLCTVLMAYAYTLRQLDISSLSQLIPSQTASTGKPRLGPIPTSSRNSQSILRLPRWNADDDDEPPPLEADDPNNSTEFAAPLPSVGTDSDSSMLDNSATVLQAFDKFGHLVPFLFPQPPPQGTSRAIATHNDQSKTLLTSLDDASIYLVSRLSLDSDVGNAGIDALNLQLLQDLSKLLHHEQLVPTFAQGQQVESKYLIASRFTSLPPQQAFAAAQMPLLLNAVADLFLFFEHVVSSASILPTRLKPKHCKLVQRKLCFYLGSAIRSDRVPTQRLDSPLPHQLRDSIQRLRQRIEAADKADKVAAAVNLLDKGAATMPKAPTINPI